MIDIIESNYTKILTKTKYMEKGKPTQQIH